MSDNDFEDQIPPFLRHLADAHDLGDQLDAEIAAIDNADVVRNNCAFCGRERSRADDNHAPECSYWDFFGGRP